MFCHQITFYYVRKAHTLFLPLSLPHTHTHTVYTHENIRANVVSAALTTVGKQFSNLKVHDISHKRSEVATALFV